MRRPDKSFPFATPYLTGIAILGILLAGCGLAERSISTAGRSTNEATPALLPTPTLAVPVLLDPLRPPTPNVLPSPTSLPGATTTEPAPAEPVELPVVEQPPASPTPISLPEGATPEELLALGRRSADEGDQATAAAAFRAVLDAPDALDDAQIAEARLGLAVALLAEGQNSDAALELEALTAAPQDRAGVLGDRSSNGTLPIAQIAAFHLGRARAAAGDHAGAIAAYETFLAANPDMAAYIQPLIADARAALGDDAGVVAALEGALDAPAQRFKAVANRSRLAALYLAQGDYTAAIAQYDAIHDIARTEATKGQMTYLAGQAELMAGNVEAARERFRFAVENYPRAAESYHALVYLVDSGAPVDDYGRGVVDYYAGAYLPGVEALRRYVAVPAEDFRSDAHLFLAWNLEGTGDVDGALAALDSFAELEPSRAAFERAELLRRAGRVEDALAAYDASLADFPDGGQAAAAAWSSAVLADEHEQPDAGARYLAMADAFPFDPNTPAALSRAADLAAAAGDSTAADGLRRRLAEQYPANVYGAEALFRLLQAADAGGADSDVAALQEQVAALPPSNYFALRAADYVAGMPPFAADDSMSLPDDPQQGRAEAEAWLRERLTAAGVVVPEGDLGALSPELLADPNRVVGEKLWQLGLLEEAKAELELVRETYADDPLANYRLALHFGELGLYRSSIIAASALLRQIEATVFNAPRFLGRLAYPVYYADLIMPLAEHYEFDPRLQFALVRQESLFESFARSGAAAQGLSQVIPDTGAWIAQRLAWPGFDNEDLYKPYVGLNFGAYYLSEQLRNFNGHVHAALAAYNGGPGNAARWLASAGADHDTFVDSVDFPETRLYIERIYEGFNAYRYLYGRP